MQLTEEQSRQLRQGNGAPLHLTDPQTNEDYVVLRAEFYEKLKELFCHLFYEDAPPTDEEKRRQLAESGRRAGWDDPDMDIYDSYDDNVINL